MITYHMMFYFYIYSLVGWLWETCLCSIREKKFINRGFLNSPICPIYGFGMVSLIVLLYPLTSRITEDSLYGFLLLFIGGLIVCTALEYVTSWILEKLFNASWWDYHDERFNINGRICLTASLFWGFMSSLLILWVHPFVKGEVESIPYGTGTIILFIVSSITLSDLILTVTHLISLKSKIASMKLVKQQFKDYIINTSLYEAAEEKVSILEMKFEDLVADIQTRIDLHDFKEDLGSKEKLNNRFNELRSKYAHYRLLNSQERRIFSAFPKMKLRTGDEIISDIRKLIKK